jgi:hypothetical protein
MVQPTLESTYRPYNCSNLHQKTNKVVKKVVEPKYLTTPYYLPLSLQSPKNGMATHMEVKATKTAYFGAIKKAESKYWNEFVINAETTDIWALHCLRIQK